MSAHSEQRTLKQFTATAIAAREGQTPIVSLTVYNAYMAELADAHCDFLLMGDD